MDQRTDRSNSRLPLAGLRVVALEQAVAAPLCTRHLADLGADVVKIERPGDGDFARGYDRAVKGISSYLVWLNRDKRSLTVDLKQKSGQEIVRRLVGQADVVVQNLGPGAAERLGLGAGQLRAVDPRLVYCSISGYGPDGPYRDKKAYDLLLQGETGILSITGYPDAPAKVGVSVCDLAAGMYAFSGILAALYERDRTGVGHTIDISLFDCMAEWVAAAALIYRYSGRQLERAGMRHNIIVPYGPYRCGDGLYANLAVQNQREWLRFCAGVMQQPELATDPRFATNADRLANRVELEALVEATFGELTRDEVERRLEAAEVANGRLNDVAALIEHPQLQVRGRWTEVASPVGKLDFLAHPFNFDGLSPQPGSIPDVGEHTDEVLADLGYSKADVARLRREGAI